MRLRHGASIVFVCGMALALLLPALTACRPPAQDPGAVATEPAAAIEQLARHLQEDDLLGFARAAVPPAEYEQLQAAWREGHSRWPLTELPLDEQLIPMLAALSAPGAEAELNRAFEHQLARQHAGVRQAAQLLGRFASEYLQHREGYTQDDRDHYLEIVAALQGWAAQAPLADPRRAPAAIARLTRQARATGLRSDADLQAAGMEDSLRRLAPFFAELKAVLADYGLPLQDTLAHLRATAIETSAPDLARARMEYPLAGRTIVATVSLQRLEGRWYLAGHLRRAAQALEREGAAPETGDEVDEAKASDAGLGDNAPDA